MKLSTLAKKGKKKIISIPSLAASKIIEMPSISAKLDAAYSAARQEHHPRLPTLSPLDAAIVTGLEQKGVFVTDLDSLGFLGTAEMFAAAQALADSYAERDRRGQLGYWDAFQANDKEILSRKEIFFWGLNRRLLDIVEVYLGLPVAFDGLNIFFTKADGRQVAARKWHLDVEDRRMVKVAIYVNDVDANGGPLQILLRDLPKSETAGRPARMIFTQEMLERAFGRSLGDDDIATCTGKAGTVIFSDTASRYHRGKPAVSRDRCAMFYNYMSRPPLRPFFCERGTLSRSQIEGLAVGLDASQRDSLLWRHELPLLARMIPPAPIG